MPIVHYPLGSDVAAGQKNFINNALIDLARPLSSAIRNVTEKGALPCDFVFLVDNDGDVYHLWVADASMLAARLRAKTLGFSLTMQDELAERLTQRLRQRERSWWMTLILVPPEVDGSDQDVAVVLLAQQQVPTPAGVNAPGGSS